MNMSDLSFLNQHCHSVDKESDLGPLLAKIKDSKLVCLGDASHGTHEFYEWRMKISMELIRHHGFQFVAFEGDWPDFEGLNNCLFGKTEESISQLLRIYFQRWPSWMWSNHEMKEFTSELRQYNLSVPASKRVRFHGLDLYSIYESAERIPIILQQLNPSLAKKVTNRLADINQSGNVLKLIDQMTTPESSEKQWLLFDARQNAKVVRNGLRFTQASGIGEDRPWNVRDHHMMETLNTLFDYYGPSSKGIVWAHINHVCDMRREGKRSSVSLGGLAKEAYGDNNVALVGFLTYSGTVIASPRWEGPLKVLDVPQAMPESVESAFNLVSQKRNKNSLLLVFDDDVRKSELSQPMPYRYIAVVYNPKQEREANYVMGTLTERFDALFFMDKTRALDPMLGPRPHEEIQPESHH